MSDPLSAAVFFLGLAVLGTIIFAVMDRHRHEFKEVGRVFCPPVDDGDVQGYGETIREAVFGVTSIENRCQCGKMEEQRLLGDHTGLMA